MRIDKIARAYLNMKVPNRYPALVTVFGEHSVKKIEEAVTPVTNYSDTEPYWLDRGLEDRLHDDHRVTEHPLVKKYTNDSLSLNSALHEHYGKTYDPAKDSTKWGQWSDNPGDSVLSDAKELDEHLQKHSAQRDFHVYTGLPHSPFRSAVYDSGNYMAHLPAFTSTSTNFRKALFFSERDNKTEHDMNVHGGAIHPGQHVLKLHVPTGTHIASVRDISPNSGENELLMNRGYDIAINPNPVMAKGESSGPVYVWSATVVRRRPKPIDVARKPFSFGNQS